MSVRVADSPDDLTVRLKTGTRTKSVRRIVVKFAEGSNVRLRNGRLMRLTEHGEAADEIELTGYENVVIERYFGEDEVRIEKERQELLITTGPEQVPDLNLYYALTPNDEGQMKALCEFLNTLDLVEVTYEEEEPDLPQVNV